MCGGVVTFGYFNGNMASEQNGRLVESESLSSVVYAIEPGNVSTGAELEGG